MAKTDVQLKQDTLKKTEASAAQVKEKVEAALQRQATTDANSIHVDTNGSQVTLTGHASSWQSVVDASNAAWAARGVSQVVPAATAKRLAQSLQGMLLFSMVFSVASTTSNS
ncbi:MAG TPA: BON domain-containing protein [Polyangiaceae bacterium]